jgi:hypothetical protein
MNEKADREMRNSFKSRAGRALGETGKRSAAAVDVFFVPRQNLAIGALGPPALLLALFEGWRCKWLGFEARHWWVFIRGPFFRSYVI